MSRRRFDAEPYPLEFEPDSTALIVIDMQRDFLEPGGFGELLGNDVSLLRSTIEPLAPTCLTRLSVTPAIAETTTATSWPSSTWALTRRATLRMRSKSATDVPPNFITKRSIARCSPRVFKWF